MADDREGEKERIDPDASVVVKLEAAPLRHYKITPLNIPLLVPRDTHTPRCS